MATTTFDRCARRSPGSRHDTPDHVDDELELRRRFKSGDPDAVRELYAVYGRPLYALSRSHLADREHAREAVQQTFLQAWRAAASFDVERPLAPWLFQICRHVCIDRYRREKQPPDRLDDHELDPALRIAGPSIERSWVVWEVRRAIDQLPPDSREIIRLMHLEGWTVEQVARHLSLPVGTVKSRSFRAHRRLVTALAHLRSDRPSEAA
jgi:RNA polymerase sigma-70 factor (ECF subfamily)